MVKDTPFRNLMFLYDTIPTKAFTYFAIHILQDGLVFGVFTSGRFYVIIAWGYKGYWECRAIRPLK